MLIVSNEHDIGDEIKDRHNEEKIAYALLSFIIRKTHTSELGYSVGSKLTLGLILTLGTSLGIPLGSPLTLGAQLGSLLCVGLALGD